MDNFKFNLKKYFIILFVKHLIKKRLQVYLEWFQKFQ